MCVCGEISLMVKVCAWRSVKTVPAVSLTEYFDSSRDKKIFLVTSYLYDRTLVTFASGVVVMQQN